MNKAELVAAVAEKAELTKKDAEKAVNSLLDSVERALVAGEKVSLVGFGTFEVRERAARRAQPSNRGRNRDCSQPGASFQSR